MSGPPSEVPDERAQRRRRGAADRRPNAQAEQRHIEHAIYGRLSPGLRASLGHRHAALQEEIEANLF